MLHRASIWKHEEIKKAYFNQTQEILFVQKRKKVLHPKPIAPIPLRKQGTGHREQDIPGLRDAFEELQQKIIANYKNIDYKFIERQYTERLPLDGEECLRNLTLNCK